MKAKRVTVTIDFLSSKAESMTLNLLVKPSLYSGFFAGPNPNYYHKSPDDAAHQLAAYRFKKGSYFVQDSGIPDGYGTIYEMTLTGAKKLESVLITIRNGWI